MIKKLLIGMLAVIGFFYVTTTIYLNTSDCFKVQKAVVTSPNGNYVVNYEQQICKSKPSEIEIWLGEQNSRTRTLVFTALATTTEQVQIIWKNESNLSIIYPSSINPTNSNSRVDNINIYFNRLH